MGNLAVVTFELLEFAYEDLIFFEFQAEFHDNIFQKFISTLKDPNSASCTGGLFTHISLLSVRSAFMKILCCLLGGRINHQPQLKKLKVYGFSQGAYLRKNRESVRSLVDIIFTLSSLEVRYPSF